MLKRITAAAAALLLAMAAAIGTASPAMAATTYHYAIGEQFGIVADGAAVNLTVENPTVDATHDGTGHSLAELAVFSADRKDRIEVGWRKPLSGSTSLFVYHAVNNVPMGYNLCTDYAPEPFNAGAAIPLALHGETSPPRFQIVHSGSAWWIAFNLKWVCHFPDSTWTAAGRTFVKVEQVQAYAEVATTGTATPCSNMGDDQLASSGTSARIGSYNLQGQTVGAAPAFTTRTAPTGVGITISVQSADTFRYGWLGYKHNTHPAADTLPGIAGC
jgi:hypothetical protein